MNWEPCTALLDVLRYNYIPRYRKGFKMDYSEFSEGDTSQNTVFSSVGAIIWGFERVWAWVGIITYPRHLRMLIWANIGGWRKFPWGLMCRSFRSAIPHRAVDSLRSRHERVYGVFDVITMVTYRSRFKGRYAHPWPLPTWNITTDKLWLSELMKD